MSEDLSLERTDAPVSRASSPIWKWAFLITLITLGLLSLAAVFLAEIRTDKDVTEEKETRSRLKFDSPLFEVPNFETPKVEEFKAEPSPEETRGPELYSLAEIRGEVQTPPDPSPREAVKPTRPEPSVPFFEPPKAAPLIAPTQGLASPKEELSPYEIARERRLKASLSGSLGGASGAPEATEGAGDGESSGLNLKVRKTATSVASRISDMTFFILKGTYISCTLDTAIVSDQAGIVGCTLPYDVYGADGTVVLLDRGSHILGEYANTTLTPGKKRIFVVWDRVRTPRGVVIDIASPGTGPLGEAGMGGKVDNHYFERVGIPVLMSAVSFSARSYARNALSSDQATFIEDSTNDGLSTVLGELARIKPTLYKNQGDPVNIVVSRDLDLSSVYELKRNHYGYTYQK